MHRSRQEHPPAEEVPQESEQGFQEDSQQEQEPEPEPEFSQLEAPPAEEPRQPSSGRVLGAPKPSTPRPANLPAYEETIVIGEKKPEPPPPPPQQQPGGAGQGQQPQQQQPSAPPAPAVDQEIIEQAKAEAQQILEQAQAQAQQIVQETSQQAQAQAQQMAQEAHQQAGQQGYEEGLQAGLEEGRQAGQQELQQHIHNLKCQFIEMVRLKRQIMVDMEPEIVNLAWQIAKRVVGEELKTNRDAIVEIVRNSLYTLQERDEILIRVNPQEFESVKAHQSEFEAMIDGLKKFTVQPDGAIEPGSCSIETNLGNVDARLETQFEAIRLGLEEMSKIRQFEKEDALQATPVEVPGDPEFEQRLKQQGHPQEQPPQEQHQAEHDGEDDYDDEEEYYEDDDQNQEMELLPEPTEELLANLSPEEQQQYIEAYHQQQAYLEQLQQQMMEEQQQQQEGE